MIPSEPPLLAGLVLAAGAGRRAGGPKALRRDPTGEPWLARAARRLAAAGCSPIHVVLGAGAEAAIPLLPRDLPDVRVTVNPNWSEGLHSSLLVGLRAVANTDREAVLITLVDLPEMPDEVPQRVVAHAPVTADTLRRASFAGRPGHPVLIGRHHWGAIAAALPIDQGAGPYLSRNGVESVDCVDLWDGDDEDGAPAASDAR